MARRTIVLLLVALGAASACGDGGDGERTAPPPSDDRASLWIGRSGVEEIVRLDLDGRERATIELCCVPRDIAIGDDVVWVSTDGERLVRIDPADDTVVTEIDVGGSAGALSPWAGDAWVAVDAAELVRVDGGTNDVESRTTVGTADAPLVGVEASEDGIWALLDFALELVRVDATSGEVNGRLPLCPAEECRVGEAAAGGVAGGTVWLVDDTALELLAIDAAGPAVRDRAPIDAGLWNVAAGAEGVFLANRDDGSLMRVDHRDPSSRARAPEPFGEPYALTVGAGAVWLYERSTGDVVRVEPDGLETIDRFPFDPIRVMAVG